VESGLPRRAIALPAELHQPKSATGLEPATHGLTVNRRPIGPSSLWNCSRVVPCGGGSLDRFSRSAPGALQVHSPASTINVPRRSSSVQVGGHSRSDDHRRAARMPGGSHTSNAGPPPGTRPPRPPGSRTGPPGPATGTRGGSPAAPGESARGPAGEPPVPGASARCSGWLGDTGGRGRRVGWPWGRSCLSHSGSGRVCPRRSCS
jgi:hypothetical protein